MSDLGNTLVVFDFDETLTNQHSYRLHQMRGNDKYTKGVPTAGQDVRANIRPGAAKTLKLLLQHHANVAIVTFHHEPVAISHYLKQMELIDDEVKNILIKCRSSELYEQNIVPNNKNDSILELLNQLTSNNKTIHNIIYIDDDIMNLAAFSQLKKRLQQACICIEASNDKNDSSHFINLMKYVLPEYCDELKKVITKEQKQILL